MLDLKQAYQDKNVLITGGLGFLGSNTAQALVPLEAKVTIVDALLPLYGGNKFNLFGIEDKVKVVIGDIRDQKLMNELVQGQDYIFNFAAQVSYVDSLSEPYLDLDINCRGHLNVLEAVRNFAPEAKILFSSSRLVYGRIKTIPVAESHPTDPLSVYGVHKLAAEKYYRIYFDRYKTKGTIIRIPNPYGPRQQMKHGKYSILGWFIRLAMENQTIKVFGDGKQERDYLFVDDIVDAALKLLASDKTAGEVYNIGTDERVCFVDMVNEVLKVVGKGKKEHIPWPENYEKNETGNYVADTTKIEKTISWKPSVKLAEGIKRTVEYYQKYRKYYW